MTGMQTLYLLVPLAPLAGAIHRWPVLRVVSGQSATGDDPAGGGVLRRILRDIRRRGQWQHVQRDGLHLAHLGRHELPDRLLIDRLSALMMVVVTFVSLMVHIYTSATCRRPGLSALFRLISLVHFLHASSGDGEQLRAAVLRLGRRGPGVLPADRLLVHAPDGGYANLKAFLVQPVGDFGFLMGIGLILAYFGTLDYTACSRRLPRCRGPRSRFSRLAWALLTVICIGLFRRRHGKSAAVPAARLAA